MSHPASKKKKQEKASEKPAKDQSTKESNPHSQTHAHRQTGMMYGAHRSIHSGALVSGAMHSLVGAVGPATTTMRGGHQHQHQYQHHHRPFHTRVHYQQESSSSQDHAPSTSVASTHAAYASSSSSSSSSQPYIHRPTSASTQQQSFYQHHQQQRHHPAHQQQHPHGQSHRLSRGGHSHHRGGGSGSGGPHHGRRDQRFRSYPRHWMAALPIESGNSSSSSSGTAVRSTSSRQVSSSFPEYSLVCYNILCGAYIDRSYFPRTPGWLLKDDYRRQTIARQLTGGVMSGHHAQHHHHHHHHPHLLSNASLIALQEVDAYDSFWRPTLAQAGYESVYKSRTATQMARSDGSLVAWKKHLFEMVDVLEIEYAIYPTTERKDNIGIGVLLQCKEEKKQGRPSSSSVSTPKYLALINTHLLFNPRRGDLKIGQCQILMNSIDAWLNRFTRSQLRKGYTQPDIDLLVCGDFNALPSSTLLQFMLDGELDLTQERAYQRMPSTPTPAPYSNKNVRAHAALGRGARALQRRHMDGTEAHHHQERMQQEEERIKAYQQQHEQRFVSTGSSTAAVSELDNLMQEKSSKRRRPNHNNEEEEEEGEDGAIINEKQVDTSIIDNAVNSNGDVSSSSSSAEPSDVDDDDDDDGDSTMLDLVAKQDALVNEDSPASPELSPESSHEGSSAFSLSNLPTSFPSASAVLPNQHYITGFFPFNKDDTPTRCTHRLKLRAAYVDHLTVEGRLQPPKVASSSSSSSTLPPVVDPLTGLPIRYRPTAHHFRQSAQVDHILFSAEPYHYDPTMWDPEKEGDAPEKVVMKRLQMEDEIMRENIRPLNEIVDLTGEGEEDESGDESPKAQSASNSSTRGLRVTSLLEFPPLSAFQPKLPHKRSHPSSAATSVSVDVEVSSSTDGGAASSTTVVTSSVDSASTPVSTSWHTRDPGLPVPDCASDHFPIAIKFRV